MIQTFLLMAFLFLSVSTFAQKPQWQQAPLNFIPDARSQDAQQVTGDVYSIDNMYYDNTRNYIGVAIKGLIEDRNWTLADINEPSFPGVIREYDSDKNLTKLTYYKDGEIDVVFDYKYNKAGYVIEAYTDGKLSSTYAYDAKNRLTNFTNLNPINKHTKKFSYIIDGELVKVSQVRIFLENNKEKKETSELHFLNGLEVYNSTRNIQNRYEYDSKGNWISKTIQQNNDAKPTTENRIITYYSQRPKAEALTLIKEYEDTNSAKPNFSLLVNGKSSSLFTIKEVPELAAIFIYNTITGDYFYVIDDAKPDTTNKTEFNVKAAYAATLFIAIYNEEGVFILDENKLITSETINTSMLGNARIFYNKPTGITYMDLDVLNNEMAIVPIEKINSNLTAFYIITKEEMLVLVDKGISMFDNKKVEIKFLENGNPVAIIEGSPKYILPPFETMTVNIIGEAYPYESGTLYDEVPNKK